MNELLVPNITCIDQDGNLVPIPSLPGSGLTFVIVSAQPVVTQDPAQLEFNFDKPTDR